MHTISCVCTKCQIFFFSLSVQVGFTDGGASYSLLPDTNATDSFDFSNYHLDSGLLPVVCCLMHMIYTNSVIMWCEVMMIKNEIFGKQNVTLCSSCKDHEATLLL